MTYDIVLSESAIQDLSELSDVIAYDFKTPLTSFRYMRGLRDKINSLKVSPESYQLQTRKSLLQYGLNVRRINYKRMAIIYTVHDNGVVYIHRIVAASTITGL